MVFRLKTSRIAGVQYVLIRHDDFARLFGRSVVEPLPTPKLLRRKKPATSPTVAPSPDPAQTAAAPRGPIRVERQDTFMDLLRATMTSIGPATDQEIEKSLEESEIALKPGKVTHYLQSLEWYGEAAKDVASGKWRLVA